MNAPPQRAALWSQANFRWLMAGGLPMVGAAAAWWFTPMRRIAAAR